MLRAVAEQRVTHFNAVRDQHIVVTVVGHHLGQRRDQGVLAVALHPRQGGLVGQRQRGGGADGEQPQDHGVAGYRLADHGLAPLFALRCP